MLEEGPQMGQIQQVDFVRKDHAVGVAHGDAGDPEILNFHARAGLVGAGDLNRHMNGLLIVQIHRHIRRGEADGPHVDGDGLDLAKAGHGPEGANAAGGLDGDLLAGNQPPIHQIFGHAAQGVAPDGGLGAIPVEQQHPHIRLLAGPQQGQAFRPGAEVIFTQPDAEAFDAVDALLEGVDEDIIIAGGLHLDETQLLAGGAHGVQVHQLRVPLGIAGQQGVRQSSSGVQAGKAGNAQGQGPAMQGDIFRQGIIQQGAGIHNVTNLSAGEEIENVVAFPQAGDGLHRDAQPGDGLGRALRGIEGTMQIMEATGQVDDLRIIIIRHAQQHAGFLLGLRDSQAGGGEPLEQSLADSFADAQHLAGGLHFRPQIGVGIGQLFEGEHRHLHGPIGRRGPQARAIAQARQGLAQHDPGGQIHHGHPRHLADIGYGAGSPGVHLDDIQLPMENQILNVYQPLRPQGQGQLLAGGDHGVHHVVIQGEGGIDGDGVAGMDAGPLHMLHDAGDQHVLPIGDDVHLQLRAGHVLIHQHGILDAVGQDAGHVGHHILIPPGDGHILSADDVAGAQQHGITQPLGGRQGLLQGQDGFPLGPADAEALQQGVEPGAILRQVDAVGAGAQDGNAMAIQGLHQADGGLATEGHHHALRLFHLHDPQDILLGQGLEIQAVGGVVIRGDGFGVIVDDHHIVTQLAQGPDAVDAGIIELNALADADGPGAQHQHHRLAGPGMEPGFAQGFRPGTQGASLFRIALSEGQTQGGLLIGGVEIRRLGVELRRAGIHHAIDRLGLGQLRPAGEPAQGPVRISQALALQILGVRQPASDGGLEIRQALQLPEEEFVYFGNFVNLVYRNSGLQGFEDGEQPMIVRPMQPLSQGGGVLGIPVQSVQADLRPADGLHQGHFEAGPDGHHFAGGLHLGSQSSGGGGEFIEGPFGHLHHHIVQRGLEAGAGLARDLVFDLVQGIAQGDAGGHLGDGISRGLGGQGGGAGHPGIDLDDRVLKALRIQGELAVAPADDAQGGDDIQRGGAEYLVLLVRQGQGRSHHHAVAGVNAYGVHILHGADGDDVADAVSHDLELDLLPPGYGFLDQHLSDGGEGQAALGDLPQSGLVRRAAAASAPQGIGGAHDDGITDLPGDIYRLLHGGGDAGGDHRLADLLHGFLKQLPVFRLFDGLRVDADEPDALLGQEALLLQLHGQGQGGLAPQARQQAVRLLLLDNALQGRHRQGLQIDLVRQGLICHDGGGVGVHQGYLHPLLPQHAAGLGAGVVKLSGLADDDGAGADHQHFADPFILRHAHRLPSAYRIGRRGNQCPSGPRRPRDGTGW